MWAARDINGSLYIYVEKPMKYLDKYWRDCSMKDFYVSEYFDIDDSVFEHVTFENSPVEFYFKPIFED